MTQQIIATLIIIAAATFAVRSVWNTLRGRKTDLNTCQSCKLKDTCTQFRTTGCNCSDKKETKKCPQKVAQSKK